MNLTTLKELKKPPCDVILKINCSYYEGPPGKSLEVTQHAKLKYLKEFRDTFAKPAYDHAILFGSILDELSEVEVVLEHACAYSKDYIQGFIGAVEIMKTKIDAILAKHGVL